MHERLLYSYFWKENFRKMQNCKLYSRMMLFAQKNKNNIYSSLKPSKVLLVLICLYSNSYISFLLCGFIRYSTCDFHGFDEIIPVLVPPLYGDVFASCSSWGGVVSVFVLFVPCGAYAFSHEDLKTLLLLLSFLQQKIE